VGERWWWWWGGVYQKLKLSRRVRQVIAAMSTARPVELRRSLLH
jgi:hypothetical protein